MKVSELNLGKGNFLKGAEPFNSGDLTYTISSVALEEGFEKGTERLVLYFRETPLKFGLNFTNQQKMIALFTDETDAWRDRRVTLFWDAAVAMHGNFVGGIRIR